MGPCLKSPYCILLVCVAILLISGCTSSPGSSGTSSTTPTSGSASSGGLPAGLVGPNNCKSIEECAAYCSANHEACDQYCRDHADICSQFSAAPSETKPSQTPVMEMGFGAGTACDTPAIKEKLMAEINKILVSPPATLNPPNWMTKILPASNPYPGYYYDLSTAFGPAVDTKVTGWSGTGEPPKIAGLDYYTVGYWEEVPKGMGGHMGEQTPDTIDFSRYQLAVFFANVSGKSQAAMINALPDLSMTEADAKAFFASKIQKSFINIEDKALTRSGNHKMYEVIWHDSDNTQDYWDVQIGTGYIAIGQGKVYAAESMLQGDPGTVWKYTACKPCENCEDWTVEKAFNRDCSKETDCLGGLSCNAGYCVKPGQGQGQPAQTTPQGTGAQGGKGPGSTCKTAGDCDSGLSCTGGVCTVPGGRP
jgi:hypothetical protein